MAGVNDLEFLGAGMLAPFRINARGDIDNGDGLRAIQSGVYTLLSTRPGELAWKPRFGTDLRRFKHRALDAETRAGVRREIISAFGRWMPLVRILSVTSKAVQEKNQLHVSVEYAIRSGRVEDASVFPAEVTIL